MTFVLGPLRTPLHSQSKGSMLWLLDCSFPLAWNGTWRPVGRGLALVKIRRCSKTVRNMKTTGPYMSKAFNKDLSLLF